MLEGLRHCYRYFILAISFVGLSSIYANQIIINFTFICMTNDANDTIILDDGSARQRYDYATQEKSLILMAVGVGTIVGTLPYMLLATRIGARRLFACSGFLSAISVALLPVSASTSFAFLVALRAFQGITFAVNYVTIGLVVVAWAPLSETATFTGVLTIYNIAATVLCNPASAAFCKSSLGWQASFYAHSIAGVAIFALWFVFYADSPSQSRFLSARELALITRGKSQAHAEGSERRVPYKAICTHRAVIVIWLVIFVELTVAILLTTYTPIYFKKVLGLSVEATGSVSSLISIVQLAFRLAFSVASDRVSCLSERIKMLLCNFIAFVIAGIFYVCIGIVPWPTAAVALFGLVACSTAANTGSVYKLAIFVSRQHAHFVISMIQFSKSLALFAGPAMVSVIVQFDEDTSGWQKLFFINGGLLILMHLPFWFVCTDQPAEFACEGIKEDGDEKGLEMQ